MPHYSVKTVEWPLCEDFWPSVTMDTVPARSIHPVVLVDPTQDAHDVDVARTVLKELQYPVDIYDIQVPAPTLLHDVRV